MSTEVKFCGLVRTADAAHAAALGATYLGVIFAGGPRRVSPARAVEVLDAGASSAGASATRTKRVGVFGALPAVEVVAIARETRLDIVQLHDDPEPRDVDALRGAFTGQVWAALRTAGAALPRSARALFTVADAVVLDARVPGALGGTGVRLPWTGLAPAVERARRGGRARLVLAGGLAPQNVVAAINALAPDIVDVSSGVERAPGVKDHDLMRAFYAAATRANPVAGPG